MSNFDHGITVKFAVVSHHVSITCTAKNRLSNRLLLHREIQNITGSGYGHDTQNSIVKMKLSDEIGGSNPCQCPISHPYASTTHDDFHTLTGAHNIDHVQIVGDNP